MAAFTLHRAAPADLPAILDAEYDSFPPTIRALLLGTPDKTYLPRLIAHSQEEMRMNPHLIWIYVRDEASKKIVAASQWKIFLGCGWEQAGHADDKVIPWLGLDGVGTAEDKQAASELVNRMNERRLAAVGGGGFVHLHICFTHPDYQRRGAGSMMLTWGTDLADRLQLPGWIEASTEGNFLYKKHGFYDYESLKDPILGGGTNMRREARSSNIATACQGKATGGILANGGSDKSLAERTRDLNMMD